MRTLQPSNQQTILVLSAGAPNSPLGAGALHALLAREGAASIDFKRIYASGGGVILALLYVAPKGIARCKGDRNAERAHRLKALAALPQQLGIDDRIYKRLPLGYKAFVKRSSWYGVMRSLTAPFKIESDSDSALAQRFPLLEKFKKTLDTRLPESNKRLYNDLVDAMTVIMTPAVFVPRSKRMRELFPWTGAFDDFVDWNGQTGICEPLPWLEDMIDFDYLNEQWDGELSIPAYHLTSDPHTRDTRVFCNRHYRERLKPERRKQVGLITADSVRASLGAPFFYPTKYLKGGDGNERDDRSPYREGAYEDPYNEEVWLNALRAELEQHPRKRKSGDQTDIRNIFIIDLLSTREMQMALLYPPDGLWDAFGQSILTPIIAQAKTTRYKIAEVIKEANRKTRLQADLQAQAKSKSVSKATLELLDKRLGVALTPDRVELTLMPPLVFGIDRQPIDRQHRVMDWSYSNLSELFRWGQNAAATYADRSFDRVDTVRDLIDGLFLDQDGQAIVAAIGSLPSVAPAPPADLLTPDGRAEALGPLLDRLAGIRDDQVAQEALLKAAKRADLAQFIGNVIERWEMMDNEVLFDTAGPQPQLPTFATLLKK